MRETGDEIKLRPEVKRLLPLFKEYLKAHGALVMWELLSKGRSGRYKLTMLKNHKDKWQMMQMLDLHKKPPVSFTALPCDCGGHFDDEITL
jgi:hypothetical protein